MILKRHVTRGKAVLAICDESLLGKRLEDDSMVLDLGSSFYKGVPVKKDDVLPFIKTAYIINAVGEESVSLLVDQNIVSKDDIKKIGAVPFVQVLFDL
ncbi:MAG: DUF424 family protein [Candidatus Woesearchaeota archaeon]|nr:DUF424 family protein [Candidatus Woesearchaeota archaeon]